jgi:ribosomal protein L9
LRKAEALAKKMGTTVMISELVAPFVYRYKLILQSYAAPSKAFLEEQAEREQAEAEALAKKMGTMVMISELVAPFVYRYKLILRSYAAPSKAFLEEQAERERTEQERAERELAKKHKVRVL